MQTTSPAFKENARRALDDAQLQKTLGFVRGRFVDKRQVAVDALPEFEALRERARAIKDHTLAHLDLYLEAFEEKVAESGGAVHYAESAADARAIILDICRTVGAKTVTKGKSMVSEEIALNHHLEANGIVEKKAAAIVETGADTLLAGDLGCLMNMAGKLKRQGQRVHARHAAEVLAGMTATPPIGEATN